MTIDKIKHYMNSSVFEHWCNVKELAIIEKAQKQLKEEIKNGILVGIQYHAELNLLNHLIG